MALDDVQRVRVLSPGMMVMKRFLRNRLSIVGMVIIVVMFAFAFIGGMLMPYSQSDVFYTNEEMKKAYAGATYIEAMQMVPAEGVQLPSDIMSKLVLAQGKGEASFSTRDGQSFEIAPLSENAQRELVITSGGKECGFICYNSFTAHDQGDKLSYQFCKNALAASIEGVDTLVMNGESYTIETLEGGNANVLLADGTEYASISNMNINAVTGGVFLTPEFKTAASVAIDADEESFVFINADGEEENYIIARKGTEYTISRYEATHIIDTYSRPSKEHLVGTDGNGMDLLARLMYGGRISLLIGFVVIAIELAIGIVVGGVAGFFGGWVDNVLMRLVDVIYCIPSIPLYLILGSIMDTYRVSPTVRIYCLCIIISIIGWVSIARIIRGQILSLREQEFMLAAEATGISVSRRIFKHLIPNVIPQLVVFATMGIGDVILTEASLSFLGLGIKYPAASWGSIINAVNDSYVLTNFPFVWIPAGTLILLTVLAFNFIGDGLRDAFDPKMKR